MFLFYSIEQRTREFRKMFRVGQVRIYYVEIRSLEESFNFPVIFLISSTNLSGCSQLMKFLLMLSFCS